VVNKELPGQIRWSVVVHAGWIGAACSATHRTANI